MRSSDEFIIVISFVGGVGIVDDGGVEMGGTGGGAGEASSSLSSWRGIFTAEIQLLVLPYHPYSVFVATSCLSVGGDPEGVFGSFNGEDSPRAHFKRFVDALERDVLQRGRLWRRREKRSRDTGLDN